MADIAYEDDYDEDEIVESEAESPRGLRRAANKSKKLEAELAAAKRELAFAKAGIPLEDPKMNYFVKGYDGELSPDAIRQAALEAGFIGNQQAPDPGVQAAAAAQDRVMSASAGAVMEDASEMAALARLEAAMAEGGVEAMLDVAQSFGIPIATDQ